MTALPRDVYEQFGDALIDETDRAAAVLGAAYLDSRLEAIFRRKLRPDTPNEVFKYRGPLGDFAAKIDLAYALGWISKDMRADLHAIRSIRNDFAHDPDHQLSFDDQSISDKTKNLSGERFWTEQQKALIRTPAFARGETPETLRKLFSKARHRFEITVGLLMLKLANGVSDESQEGSSDS